MSDFVCKGAWQLGTACGRCESCQALLPAFLSSLRRRIEDLERAEGADQVAESCHACGKSMGEAVAFTVPLDAKRVAFGGYRCGCGRRSWRASPVGREITEVEWLVGFKAAELGL